MMTRESRRGTVMFSVAVASLEEGGTPRDTPSREGETRMKYKKCG